MKKYVINKLKLIDNINMIIEKAAPSKVIAVLKGNGYGLGMVPYAEILIQQGIDMLAVAEMDEAVTLRNADISREILLLSSTAVETDAKSIVDLELIGTIGSIEALHALEKAAKSADRPVNAHLKIDSGFGRFGFMPGGEKSLADEIKKLKHVKITGIYTHLSASFAKDNRIALNQKVIFDNCIDALEKEGVDLGIKHIANSCAFLRWEGFKCDAVRIGSAFLGRLPITVSLPLNKIGELKSQIIETKRLPKGHNVGYANTYKTKRETLIGIIPVGYKDGFGVDRQQDTFRIIDVIRVMASAFFAKPQSVIAGGKRVPLIGRIGMYNIIVDLTGTNIKTGDEVILQCSSIMLDSGVERSYE